MTHVIHRTQFDFSISSQKKALEIQHQMQAILYEKLLPQMDALFSKLVPDGVICRLDRLEIDLGKIGFQNIESTVLEAVNNQILEQIETQIAAIKSGVSTSEYGKIEWSPEPKTKTESLIFFLETGLLPWWSKDSRPSDLIMEILENDAAELFDFLEQKAAEKVWNRIAKQFSKAIIYQIIKSKDSVKFEVFKKIEADFSLLKINILEGVFFEKTILKFLFKNNGDWSSFYIKILKNHFEKSNIESGKIAVENAVKNLELNIQKLPAASPLKIWFEKLDESKLRVDTLVKITDLPKNKIIENEQSKKVEREAFSELEIKRLHQIELEESIQEKENLSQKIQEVLEKGVLVNNAGIVILGPFLSPFFKKIGLAKGKKFVSEAAKERAVLMCDYLVNGNVEVLESEAVMYKILCGFPLEEPIERELKITEQEVLEVEDLLKSVIEHWGALGKTSPTGFQNAFLKREGRLIAGERSFSLKIDRVGHDALLEKLPWSFGLIRLPWMVKPLEVEW